MHRRNLLIWILGLGTGVVWIQSGAIASDTHALAKVLEQRRCEGCKLQDADLAQADLREARLKGSSLQRANLSGAVMDGADLSNADLSFSSLAGASLRNANLKGAILIGTDLRGSNLSGAKLERGGLNRSHWQQANGIPIEILSYADLHNAGINAALAGRHLEAEYFLNNAIRREPNATVSLVARGLSRIELGNINGAAQDLHEASQLYASMGDSEQATALERASTLLNEPEPSRKTGNNIGGNLASGAIRAFQILAPIAAKALMPTFF
ncbi:MAG: pentapeptide repeat-containing protein [Cyanobacteria bacterium M_surface_10_m2_179]|nr:pentapeptide repeat-containing protein [Cyanobacteria bacterium M_surface_10_m2_179]